jgi:hypothetical protein
VPGAEEQTNAKAALKLRDRFRNRRWPMRSCRAAPKKKNRSRNMASETGKRICRHASQAGISEGNRPAFPFEICQWSGALMVLARTGGIQ